MSPFTRLTASVSLAAVVVADTAAPRELFDASSVQITGNGVQNPFSAMMSQMMNGGASQNGMNGGGANPFGQFGGQPGNPWGTPQGQSQNPFQQNGNDPFGNAGVPQLSDDPFGGGSFGQPDHSHNNHGMGGPPLTAQTGTVIMQSMITSFLANRPLAEGEKQCLISGTSRIGGDVVQVSANVMGLAKQMLAMHKMATGEKPAQPAQAQDPFSGGGNPFDAGNSNGHKAFNPAPAPPPPPPPAPAPPPPIPATSQNALDVFFNGGRRLQMGMNPMMMGGSGPMAMMGGMTTMMSLGTEVQKIMTLGHTVMSHCLKGDGKAAFETALANAKNIQVVSQHVMGNGADLCMELADALKSWESADAKGFGSAMGTMMRKTFLSTNTGGMLPEGLPPKKSLMNVTAGFMQGFFGPGSRMSITTPETGNTPIQINLNKCVGRNVNLMETMWKSMMYFYGKQSAMGRGQMSSYQNPQDAQQFATMLAYSAMRMKQGMQLCGVTGDQKEMLEDAIRGMGKGTNFDFHPPPMASMSKTQAASKMAQTVGDYNRLVQDPSQGQSFGKNLGMLFQEMVHKRFQQKYEVDNYGNLKKRLVALDDASSWVNTGTGSIVAPVALAVLVVLLVGTVVALKSRRALAGWRSHWCAEDRCGGKTRPDADLEMEDVEAHRRPIISDQVGVE